MGANLSGGKSSPKIVDINWDRDKHTMSKAKVVNVDFAKHMEEGLVTFSKEVGKGVMEAASAPAVDVAKKAVKKAVKKDKLEQGFRQRNTMLNKPMMGMRSAETKSRLAVSKFYKPIG